jgi:hypothetical protein
MGLRIHVSAGTTLSLGRLFPFLLTVRRRSSDRRRLNDAFEGE